MGLTPLLMYVQLRQPQKAWLLKILNLIIFHLWKSVRALFGATFFTKHQQHQFRNTIFAHFFGFFSVIYLIHFDAKNYSCKTWIYSKYLRKFQNFIFHRKRGCFPTKCFRTLFDDKPLNNWPNGQCTIFSQNETKT